MQITTFNKTLRVFLASALAISMSLPAVALADDTSDAEDKVASANESYQEALDKADAIAEQISENEAKLSELNEKIPVQTELASAAMIELYRLDGNMNLLIDWLLGIENITDALQNLFYIEHVRDKYLSELSSLNSMKEEAEELQTTLEEQKKEADDLVKVAQDALAQAEAERDAIVAAAAAQAAADAEAAAKAAAEAEANKNQSYDDYSDPSDPNEVVDTNGVDWSLSRADFVSTWASRINNYLSGSPMAGTGQVFAEAAYDNGVDPRWSPAIAYLESSLGRYCFRSYNAWGWGSVSWGSWEEAIRSHVRGLASGYGSTITTAAAKKYCPPNWQHWYSVVSGQMNRI